MCFFTARCVCVCAHAQYGIICTICSFPCAHVFLCLGFYVHMYTLCLMCMHVLYIYINNVCSCVCLCLEVYISIKKGALSEYVSYVYMMTSCLLWM